MADFETRTRTATFEMRDDPATGAPTLEGYAATFSQEYDLGPFREQIAPEAFTRTLTNGADVRLLIDHEGQPLARTKSGTLQLSADSTGLHARAQLDPADPDVQRLLPKMRRGDLDQMSFAFRVPAGGDEWEQDFTLRTIREANLAGGDVSVVTYPANPNTSVALRSKDVLDAEVLFISRMLEEIRSGSALSAGNYDRLQASFRSLTSMGQPIPAAVTEMVTEAVEPSKRTVSDFDRRRSVALSL